MNNQSFSPFPSKDDLLLPQWHPLTSFVLQTFIAELTPPKHRNWASIAYKNMKIELNEKFQVQVPKTPVKEFKKLVLEIAEILAERHSTINQTSAIALQFLELHNGSEQCAGLVQQLAVQNVENTGIHGLNLPPMQGTQRDFDHGISDTAQCTTMGQFSSDHGTASGEATLSLIMAKLNMMESNREADRQELNLLCQEMSLKMTRLEAKLTSLEIAVGSIRSMLNVHDCQEVPEPTAQGHEPNWLDNDPDIKLPKVETFTLGATSINDFKVVPRELGEGKFASVFLAAERSTKGLFCLKVFKATAELDDIKLEAELHGRLHHPNIISMFGIISNQPLPSLVLEYAPHSDLRKLLNENAAASTKLPNDKLAKYTVQISNALSFMHSKLIMHRDIKPENLLLGSNHEIKIGDFGLATTTTIEQTEVCGSCWYLAPEMIYFRKYDNRIDIWALGIVVYECFYGRCPFEDDDLDALQKKIVHDPIKYAPRKSGFQEFIDKLLQKHPKHRLVLDEVPNQKWILATLRK